jgi:hypothetical protein
MAGCILNLCPPSRQRQREFLRDQSHCFDGKGQVYRPQWFNRKTL